MAVYFLRCSVTNLVKIGFTGNERPGVRIRSLMAQGPTRITLVSLIPGSRTTEREFHDRFRHVQEIGEWFRLNDSDIPVSMISLRLEKHILKNKVAQVVPGDFSRSDEEREDIRTRRQDEREKRKSEKRKTKADSKVDLFLKKLMEPIPESLPEPEKRLIQRETWEEYQARWLASGRSSG